MLFRSISSYKASSSTVASFTRNFNLLHIKGPRTSNTESITSFTSFHRGTTSVNHSITTRTNSSWKEGSVRRTFDFFNSRNSPFHEKEYRRRGMNSTVVPTNFLSRTLLLRQGIQSSSTISTNLFTTHRRFVSTMSRRQVSMNRRSREHVSFNTRFDRRLRGVINVSTIHRDPLVNFLSNQTFHGKVKRQSTSFSSIHSIHGSFPSSYFHNFRI